MLREIEIWFVVWRERLYLFAETREAAGWVKNIRRNPKVMVRVGEWRTDATARVLDPHDGLPVEITRFPQELPLRPQEDNQRPLRKPSRAQ